MISYNGRQYSYCSISRNACLLAAGKKYRLIKAEGISYSPSHTDYPNYKSGKDVSLSFRLYFQPLPDSTTYFNFSEDESDGWQINAVELHHGKVYAVDGKMVETSSHVWNCTSVEVQMGQTILTKTVQPKHSGTYMYSGQDEYIEDADTGRKYYLQNSSIGFEGSPKISNDTRTITFYEVYPALPSTVKRINISSGSQYYIKGLRIR